MAAVTLNPFQILLNNLNHELNDRNLDSLIHVCGDYITGAQKERICSGYDVFSILRHQNIIGSEPEKMGNLLAIIKELKPKRRDLVDKVKQHIQEYYEEPEEILKGFESSWDSNRIRHVVSSSRSSTPSPIEECCGLHCCGCACNYNYHNPCCKACCNACCNWCGFILGGLFVLFAIVATLAWYCHLPRATRYLQSTDDLRHTGPFVIGGLGFLAACSVVCGICIKCYKRKKARKYTALPDYPEISSNQASYAASDSTRTSPLYRSATPRQIYRSRSCSTQYTTSSSLASRTSSRIPPPLGGADSVPDGLQQVEFFIPQVDTEEDKPEKV